MQKMKMFSSKISHQHLPNFLSLEWTFLLRSLGTNFGEFVFDDTISEEVFGTMFLLSDYVE